MTFLDEYSYNLPEELIAHEPVTPRDSARLLVYDTKEEEITFHRVADLPKLLPKALFVYNNTRVEPARLRGVGENNTPVELLILVDQGFTDNRVVRALVNRFTPVGEVITIKNQTFTVLENNEKSMLLCFSDDEAALITLLQEEGETPLPPYIVSTQTEEMRRVRYQTIFAEDAVSIAAPTASLHFTRELIENLQATGAHFSPITLQVGLGTFAPIFPEHFETKALHREFCSVPQSSAATILKAKVEEIPIVSIGTTVTRTLETFKDEINAGTGAFGSTEIFIYPPHTFTFPDVLMTNFHVPKSSLMCLVDAFLKHKGAKRDLIDLYHRAIAEHFRFYSFGDAMLIL